MFVNIGIDLGTTNSCIAIATNSKEVEVVNVNNQELVRSAVNYADPKSIRVGDSVIVNNERNIHRKKVVFNNKCVLGKKYTEVEAKRLEKLCQATVKEDGDGFCGFSFPGMEQVVTTKNVLTEIIKVLYEAALTKINKTYQIRGVWISIPSTFTQYQKDITRKAAEAVIKTYPIHFISEPAAAAILYGVSNQLSNGNVLIYDMGGGTFDVSIIRIQDQTHYEILRNDGDSSIGGNFFDEKLSELIEEKFRRQNDGRLLEDMDNSMANFVSNWQLLSEAEKLKKNLSINDRASFHISEFYERLDHKLSEDTPMNDENDDTNITPVLGDIYVKREEFEEVIKNAIEETIEITERCITNNNLQIKDISCVLLVGGSTYIPLVQKRLKDVFGNIVQQDVNKVTCVAKGAALRGFLDLEEKLGGVIERNYYEIALKTTKEGFITIIPANSQLPCSGKKRQWLSANNIGYVETSIYEKVGNKYELVMKDWLESESLKFRKVSIEIEYHLTKEGELNVKYFEIQNDRRIEITHNQNRMIPL